jgi:acyl carrier protein
LEAILENLDSYRKVFVESFGVDDADVSSLSYESILDWDSVGHMGLIAEIEEVFGVELEMDDVIEFSSYEKGIEILKKYGIAI